MNAKESVVTITEIPFRNMVAEFQEQPLWEGDKVNVEKNAESIVITVGSMSGTYTTPVRDFGYVASVYIGIDVVVATSLGRRFNSDGVTKFNDSLTYRFTGQETLRATSFRIRTSEDNITWRDWETYQPGDYYCRYFQIELTLYRENLGDEITCSTFEYFGDLPDVDDSGNDTVVSAADGKEVFFIKTYHEEPSVHIEIRSGNGIYSKFVDKSTTGFKVKLYDAQGVAQAGMFDWHSHGI
jgi:hypothetical protein